MNKTNVRHLARVLLRGELATRQRGKRVGYNQGPVFNDSGFYPDRSGHGCGTVACICGTGNIIITGKAAGGRKAWVKTRDWLGINETTAQDLFASTPWTNQEPIQKVTAAEAAMVLFNLAETGKVDWQIVLDAREQSRVAA